MAKPIKIEILGDASGFEKATNKVEGGLGKLGGIAAGAGLAIAGGVAAGAVGLVKLGQTFDKEYDKIRVGTGATGKTLEGLEGSFKNMLKRVPTDFDSAGTAIANLNTALGTTGAELERSAEQFLNLSRITGSDVETSIANATRAFGDWGVAAEDQAGFMDKLFRASQATGSSVDTLAQQVVQFGAPMRGMGFSIDETTALLGLFEKTGVNTELVMGSMRQALGKFAKEGKDAPVALRELMEQIKAAPDDTQAASMAMEIFGARAGADMADTIRGGKFEISELIDTIASGEDTINSVAGETASFSEKWQLFKNRVLVGLEPLAMKVFDALGKGMDILSSWWTQHGSTVTGGMEAIVKVIGRVADAFGDGGLGGAVSEIGALFKRVWPSVQKTLGDFLQNAISWIKDAAPKFAKQLQEWGKAFVEWVGPQIPPLLMKLGELLSSLLDWALETGLPKLGAMLSDWGEAFVKWVGPMIPPLIVEVGKLLARLTRWIVTEGIPKITAKLDEWAKAFREWIGPMIPPALAELGKFLVSIGNWIVTEAVPKLVSKLVSMGGDMIAGLIRGLWNKAGDLKDAVTKVVTDNVPGPVKKLLGISSPSKVFFTFGEEVVEGFVNGLKDGTAYIYRTMQDIFGGAVDQVGTMIGGLGTLRGNHDAKRELDEARAAQKALENSRAMTAAEQSVYQQRLADAMDDLAASEAFVNKVRQDGTATTYEMLTHERDLEKFRAHAKRMEDEYQRSLTARPATQAELEAANERVIQAELRMIQTQGSLIKLGQELETTNDAGSEMFRHLAESVGMTEGRIAELTGWLNTHQSQNLDWTMANAQLAESYDAVAAAIQRANKAAAERAEAGKKKSGPKGDGPGAIGALNRTPKGSSMPVVTSGRAADWAKAAVAQFGGRITSTYRNPAHNKRIGGSPTSYHLDRSNPAADIVTSNMQGTFNWLAKNYGSNIREMIYGNKMLKRGRMMAYRRNDHWDHVHVAHGGGRVTEDWPKMRGLSSDERPAILQVGEEVIPKNRAGATMVRNDFHISVSVAPGTDKSEVGREIVETIKAYERRNGSRWRS